MSYQVLARKYRPKTFQEVIGQPSIVKTLQNALRFQSISQAYLFSGSRGIGKTTIARLFAKALNCENLTKDFEPCNKCISCQEISSGNSLDVLEIDGASNRGIDDIRQINETVGFASYGKYKIYIIDEVHMLTKEAFNALLKTLEEPPPTVKFFFATTEPHKIPPTILSRCQRFDLYSLSSPQIIEKLSFIAKDLNREAEPLALALIAKAADGSLRDAESLFDRILCHEEGLITEKNVSSLLGWVSLERFKALDEAVQKTDLSFGIKLVQELLSSAKDLSFFVEQLADHYRSILHKILQKQETPYTQSQCLYILEETLKTLQQLPKTPSKQVAVEILLLKILESQSRMTLPDLMKRLLDLESHLKENSKTPLDPDTAIRFATVELEGILKID